MLYDKIGKFFNIRTTSISNNGNVKRDLWTHNVSNSNITSQIDYPYIYDQNSIRELLVKFNEVKFKDISSMNLLPKQKYFSRFLFKMPDSKGDPSYSKLYNYNLTTLEEEKDHKMSRKGSINNDTRRTSKKNHRRKYFKVQLNDNDKRRSIKFDLHPMVEQFMNRTMDKLTANIPKEKQYKRKTKKELDHEDEEEEREKLRIMKVLKDLQKEEEEEKKQKKHSSQLLSVSSNLPTSDDLLQENDGAGKIQRTSSSIIISTLSKSDNSSILQTVSASEQSGAVYVPTSSRIDVVTLERDVDDLKRELSVFDPGISDSRAEEHTNPHPVDVLAKVEKKDSPSVMSNNVRKQNLMAPKQLKILNRKEIGVLYDSNLYDQAVTKHKKETANGNEKKQTNDLGVQIVEFEKTPNNKSLINIDKSTSSHDLMKKDAATITEPNSKTKSKKEQNNMLHFADADHVTYPLYSIEESGTENTVYKQIEISPLKRHNTINIIENNNILNLEQTGQNTITDLQFSHHKIPNNDVLYLNYKSPLFQIKLKEFLQNNLVGNRKHLIYNRNTGNIEIPCRLNRENIMDIPKIKEEISFCYNNMKNNITKKHSRISTIKRSNIVRKLAATCAYPSIKSTNVGVAKSNNKGNKLYFNSKVLLSNEKTVNNKIDKTVVNQCINGIDTKNEIVQTLRRINSLRDVSDNLENFLKDLNGIKDDESRIAATIISSHFKENRIKSGNSNIGKQKRAHCVRNEPLNNGNRHKFPKNSQHTIVPIYINTDTLNNKYCEGSENENFISSETNSVSTKTSQKTTMIPAAHKKVYIENFRKPNKEIVNKIVNVEQNKQYNKSFSLNEKSDGKQEEIKSMKVYNSVSQYLTSKKFIDSTMFMQKENSIDYDLGTEKQETCNSEEMYEIIQFTGSNAVRESNYLLSNECNNSNNQSKIQFNVDCQNFKTVEFNNYRDLYTNKIILPKCIDNFTVTGEQTEQENYVNKEIKDGNEIFEQQKNSNNSKQSISNSNGNNDYFKHKKTKQILQENQPYETADTVNQRKPSPVEIYETFSENTVSQSNRRSESTQPFYGNLSNSTIVCNNINSFYTDTIYSDSEKNKSSTTKFFENNTLNSGYGKHEEVYNVSNDQNNSNNNEKIVQNAIEVIPLFNIEEYDIYSTGKSTNKLTDCTPSAISKNKISTFSNQTENTDSTTLLFSLNSEFYINETSTNKSRNMMNEKSTMLNNHDHKVNIKLENKLSSDVIYETLSEQSSGKDNVGKPDDNVNSKGYYFEKEINKENFKQTTDACNKSIVKSNDVDFEKFTRNSITVVYI